MDGSISRQAAINEIKEIYEWHDNVTKERIIEHFMQLPSAQPEIIRCKDCIHQEKFFHEDKRRRDGGYYIYGCELVDGYSHVCLDDDFCSRGERRTDENNNSI